MSGDALPVVGHGSQWPDGEWYMVPHHLARTDDGDEPLVTLASAVAHAAAERAAGAAQERALILAWLRGDELADLQRAWALADCIECGEHTRHPTHSA